MNLIIVLRRMVPVKPELGGSTAKLIEPKNRVLMKLTAVGYRLLYDDFRDESSSHLYQLSTHGLRFPSDLIFELLRLNLGTL